MAEPVGAGQVCPTDSPQTQACNEDACAAVEYTAEELALCDPVTVSCVPATDDAAATCACKPGYTGDGTVGGYTDLNACADTYAHVHVYNLI
jgi:hypothetical protein